MQSGRYEILCRQVLMSCSGPEHGSTEHDVTARASKRRGVGRELTSFPYRLDKPATQCPCATLQKPIAHCRLSEVAANVISDRRGRD
jgi:hypothetical protein